MVGIIGAMDSEIESFTMLMKDIKEISIHGFVFYEGKLSDKNVIVVKSGVGKAAAASITTLLIDHFPINLIINVGIAGGNGKKIKPNMLVIADKVAYNDVDRTAIDNNVFGQMEDCPLYFEADEETVTRLKEIEPDSIVGGILSGDTFVGSEGFVNTMDEKFKDFNYVGFDMESASIAQICYRFDIKFAVLRYISDVVGDYEDKYKVYSYVKETSSYRLISIIEEFLKAKSN